MPAGTPRTHVSEFRVRYAETDQMGVVYHANYLVWCEIGRTDYIRAHGLAYAEMERRGVKLAVMEANVRYHAGARYDDLVRVETRLVEVKSRSVRFDYLVLHAGTGTKLVSAWTTLVSLDADGRMASFPADIRRYLDDALS